MAERASSTRADARPHPLNPHPLHERIEPALVNRRALVAGLVLSPVAALPAIAGGHHPDAELLRLYSEWKQVAEDCDRVQRQVSTMEDALDEIAPKLPERAFVQEEDGALGLLRYWTTNMKDNREWYPPGSIEKLRNLNAPRLHAATQVRVHEILEIYDAYNKAKSEAHEAVGLTVARDKQDRLDARNRKLRHAICAIPAKTIEGVTAKAFLVEHCFDGADYLAKAAESGGVTGDDIALKVVAELLRVSRTSEGRANV
ncbi:MAG: hypothetical protein Q8M31_23800 [Beijerinckiaceae bacterium]|nr:hypothetical protein [Beijerinckiaceae bacterium]